MNPTDHHNPITRDRPLPHHQSGPGGAGHPEGRHGAGRALGLFVVRESDEFDLELFNAMREHTYLQHKHLPEVDAVRQVGLDPMGADGSFIVRHRHTNGRIENVEVVAEPYRSGKTRAILFCYGGYWHLWSRASAASVGADGVNDFTSILIQVIEKHRPVNLFAANFSRLIRSQAQGAWLQSRLDGNVDTVWAGGTPFVLTGAQKQVGMMMFSMFAMVASMERDWIVQRLMAGRVAKWRRGEWPYGKATVPFGYRYDAKTRRLVADENLQPLVRKMMLILSSGLPPAEAQRQLSELEMPAMRRNRRANREISVGALVSASALIDGLFAWAPLWCRGEYLHRTKNVFPGLEELAGVRVTRLDDDPEDEGELQMLCKVPLPENGWAEPEVLDAFADAAIRRSRTLVAKGRTDVRPLAPDVMETSSDPTLLGALLNADRSRGNDPVNQERRTRARAKRKLAPLAGRRWEDDQWVYELNVVTRGVYELVRSPKINSAVNAVVNHIGGAR